MDSLLYTHPAYRLARIAEMASAGVRSATLLTVGNPKQLLPQNTRRIAFTIGLSAGSDLWIWIDGSVTAQNGFHLDSGQQPRTFSVDADGPWVQGPIWVTGAGATIVVCLIETAIMDGEFDPSDLTYKAVIGNG